MKWLIPAATFLLSVEVAAIKCSEEKIGACFVTSSPSHVSTQPKQIDAVSYLNIGSRQPLLQYEQQSRKDSTALPMGIRSMLGLGKKKAKDDDERKKSDNPKDIKAALEAIKADLEAVTDEDEVEKTPTKAGKVTVEKKKIALKLTPQEKKNSIVNPVSRGRTDSSSSPTTATTYGETVRDRINRVKKGQMTDEEKTAFLNNALTRKTNEPSRPRIRQEIPDASDSDQKSSSSSSSAGPRDALWNTVMGSGSGSGSSSSASKSKTGRHANINLLSKDDSAKREYLDMVTNPDRFKAYAAMGGNRSSSASANKVNNGNVVDNSTMLDTSPLEQEEDGLASRLESAAILKEQKDSEARAKKEEEDRAYKARLYEEQRRRSEEISRSAQEKLASQRASEERSRNQEEEKRTAAQKRVSDMQAAQDDYWAKKMEEENKRKERSMTPDDTSKLEEKRREDASGILAASARAAAKQAEVEMLREEEKERENPHEADILREAAEDALRERERNAEIMEQSAARTSRTVAQPTAADLSSDSFVEQQEKKKAALDEFMKTQNERLASLNSPLPFLGKKISKDEPQRPAKPQGIMPSLNLTDLTMKRDTSAKTAPAPAPVPRLNLAELTMAKKPAASAPGPAEVKMPSLAEMTMLKKTQTGGAPPSTPKRNAPSSAEPSSAPRPIRQNIPINNDDDDEDDFFEYSRNGGNSGMSLRDIMSKETGSSSSGGKSDSAKNQSKMWGIDIDKFMD